MGKDQQESYKYGEPDDEQLVEDIVAGCEEYIYSNEAAPSKELEEPVAGNFFKKGQHFNKAIQTLEQGMVNFTNGFRAISMDFNELWSF